MNVVLACRGCCCGTSKHPHTDHDAQLTVLAAAVGEDLEVTSCLGPCRWSNVVVAVDPDTGEQAWFGKVLSPADTASVTDWLVDPEGAPRPHHLERRPARPDHERALRIARSRTRTVTRRQQR